MIHSPRRKLKVLTKSLSREVLTMIHSPRRKLKVLTKSRVRFSP